jgi:hypothetical protein
MMRATHTFELSDDDIKTAIEEYIVKRFGDGEPLVVHVVAKSVLKGFGSGEYEDYEVKVTATRNAK